MFSCKLGRINNFFELLLLDIELVTDLDLKEVVKMLNIFKKKPMYILWN